MNYADQLAARIKSTSPICVGLDPILSKLPDGITKDADGVKKFCMGIIDAVSEKAAAVKPQLAYFEVLGWEGMKVLFEVSAYAKSKNLIVIADGKRNDIGSTCDAYAEAYLGSDKPFDALTVNPYLGSDGIRPFMKLCEKNGKGMYVLVKTSNESSGELQDLPVGDEVVHEALAQLTESWATELLGNESNLSSMGAVVGATYPEELKYLRTLMPHVPFLIPGYGAQGGTAADIKYGFLPNGTGAIINAGRSILFASAGKDWAKAAENALDAMKEEIGGILHK